MGDIGVRYTVKWQECRKGRMEMRKVFKHNDFTAVFSDEGTGPNNRYYSFTGEINSGSGACGDKIVRIYPTFKVLNDLHLAKYPDGEPMYALENGFYHFKESKWNIKKLEGYWKIELNKEQKDSISFPLSMLEIEIKSIVKEIMEEVRPLWKAKVEEARRLLASTPSDLTEIDESVNIDDFDEPEKVRALAAWLDIHFSIITEDGDRYTAEGITYQILSDDEADEAWDKSLDNYLDECVLPELPENMRNYFDDDKWKHDARSDGRGHSLGYYDGEENEITDPETGIIYFAYRQ
jgi:hypothetical protein